MVKYNLKKVNANNNLKTHEVFVSWRERLLSKIYKCLFIFLMSRDLKLENYSDRLQQKIHMMMQIENALWRATVDLATGNPNDVKYWRGERSCKIEYSLEATQSC
jgi:hypothetical protein